MVRIAFFALFAPAVVMAASPGMPVTAEIRTCFTPGPVSCADAIADTIDGAQVSVRVQAYWLTSLPILHALAAAQHREVDVQTILDKTQDRTTDPHGRYTPAVYLVHTGVRVWIDDILAIAHNKVLILDGARIATGSCNFTKSADTRNAETVIFVDSPEAAASYAANWESRRALSREFVAE